MHWHNHEHRHSGIRYVTPAERHDGRDHEILRRRHDLYLQARDRNPRRWSGDTRNGSRIEQVTLNPEKERAVTAGTTLGTHDKEQLAA